MVAFAENYSGLLEVNLFYWKLFCFIDNCSALLKIVLLHWKLLCFIDTRSYFTLFVTALINHFIVFFRLMRYIISFSIPIDYVIHFDYSFNTTKSNAAILSNCSNPNISGVFLYDLVRGENWSNASCIALFDAKPFLVAHEGIRNMSRKVAMIGECIRTQLS